MINKKNWRLVKDFLDYRLRVDQICMGSMKKEETHLRYLLEWAGERLFSQAGTIRPTFPEYMLTNRLDGLEGQLSAVYIKKALASARLFFLWLVDSQPGYKKIKIEWIKTLKVKRLSNVPKTKEAVTLQEILKIASAPAETIMERRARAAAVLLFLSGARIGAFVSLPIQAVDIPNRKIEQFPNLGVRTKNKKYGVTFLLDIPVLLKVVQDWDNEVRAVLPPNGFWFAPLSPETGQIDQTVNTIGEHRITIARRNIKSWMDKNNLPYHSPHKFRHGHIHYGQEHAYSIEDFKAVSLNVMHSSMEITDQFYSNLNDGQVQNRISALGKKEKAKGNNEDAFTQFQEFLEWKRQKA